ncbi:MAG: gamma-glutamyltransferase [Pseudohongiellaceae bacterium]
MFKSILTRSIAVLLIVVLSGSGQLFANTVTGENGAVASRSALASDVGVEILKQGGNAIDAAVAVGFALAVTYPSAGNIGGGGFMVVRLANGEVLAQDHREKAPLAASTDMFLDANGDVDRELSLFSLQASGVPGSVAGMLDALEKYGTMTRQEVMAPAIRLAEEGFVLNADLAGDFNDTMPYFQRHEASQAIFSKNGSPYQAGDLFVQKDLAESLKRVSEQGRDGFYKGPTADMIVAEMQRNGGLISHEDLESYDVVWRTPMRGDYRGHEIWSMPPPSSGGVVLLQILNMLEPHDIGELGWGSTRTVHLTVEALRRAYADRAEHLGDPDFYPVPVEKLVSKDYARERFADMNPAAASDSEQIFAGNWNTESTETTHYSVVDADGNAVSVTTTLNGSYGNRIVVPGAGFLLNNEMDDFSAKPGAPNMYGLLGGEANKIEPGKRMLSSMTPTIVVKDGQTLLVTGSPGGSTIINTVLHVVMNVIDHGMGVEEAVAKPRFYHQWKPDVVRYETNSFSAETKAELEAMGHRGLTDSGYGYGDANSIVIRDGQIEATSDPRSVGGASAY